MNNEHGDYPPKSPLSKGDFENREFVGWVEVTKPNSTKFVGWVEVTKPNSTKLCWAVPALRLPFDFAQGERSGTAVAEGFSYRSTQPTIAQ